VRLQVRSQPSYILMNNSLFVSDTYYWSAPIMQERERERERERKETQFSYNTITYIRCDRTHTLMRAVGLITCRAGSSDNRARIKLISLTHIGGMKGSFSSYPRIDFFSNSICIQVGDTYLSRGGSGSNPCVVRYEAQEAPRGDSNHSKVTAAGVVAAAVAAVRPFVPARRRR